MTSWGALLVSLLSLATVLILTTLSTSVSSARGCMRSTYEWACQKFSPVSEKKQRLVDKFVNCRERKFMSEAVIEHGFAFNHACEILGAIALIGRCTAELLPSTSTSPKLAAGVGRLESAWSLDKADVCEQRIQLPEDEECD